jgi:hypothetical protein
LANEQSEGEEARVTLEQLERQVRLLKAYAALLTVVLTFLLFNTSRLAPDQKPRFTEIDVERINIIEPDGRPAVVLANSHRMPRVILDGREQPGPNRLGSAGLIFVDAQGAEVGGLIYGSTVRSDGTYMATRSFTFDQHNQDQVLGIQYYDVGSIRTYGLSLWDQPSQFTMREVLEAVGGATERQVIRERILGLAKSRGVPSPPGLRRLFLGNENGTVGLHLADSEGRERIRLVVDHKQTARMDFLDATGRVVDSFPNPSK